PWRRLSEEEVALGEWLSADLYKLGKRRSPHARTQPAWRLLDRLVSLVKHKNWVEVLPIIDDASKYLDQDSAHGLKFRMLRELGCLEAAEEYAEAAYRLNPRKPDHARSLL